MQIVILNIKYIEIINNFPNLEEIPEIIPKIGKEIISLCASGLRSIYTTDWSIPQMLPPMIFVKYEKYNNIIILTILNILTENTFVFIKGEEIKKATNGNIKVLNFSFFSLMRFDANIKKHDVIIEIKDSKKHSKNDLKFNP